MESKIDRNDALKKVEKKDIFRRILYGMKNVVSLLIGKLLRMSFKGKVRNWLS